MPVDDQEPRYRLAIQDVDGNIVDRLGTLYAEADGTLKIQEGSGSFNEASLNPDGTFSVPTAPDNADEVARKEELDGKADTPHDLAGDDHSEDTLANLNSKVSDADLATNPHGNENHEPNFAEDPHDNSAHSESYITGIDTADSGVDLGEAVRYVFGDGLTLTDVGGGEIEIDGPEGGVETVDPNNAVVGEAPDAQEDDSISIGSSFDGEGNRTIARFPRDIALGSGAQTDRLDTDPISGNIAIGEGASASGRQDDPAIAIGRGATASNTSATAVGQNAEADGSVTIAIGQDTKAPSFAGTAVGQNAEADGFATALGNSTKALGSSATAVGRGAEALNDDDGTLGRQETNWTVPGDFTVNGSKNFEIDHPSKPETHDLKHGAYEGPVAGGLIYSETVTVDGTKTSLGGVLPDYITNNDFGRGWTDHVNENNGFGTGYIDTETWTLHVKHSGEYDVTLIGERDDDKALENGKHRTEKPKGERWNGDPRTYWLDVGRIDTDDYDGVDRVEAKYDHTAECSPTPCKEAFDSFRVTFDDGERVVVESLEYEAAAQEIINVARE